MVRTDQTATGPTCDGDAAVTYRWEKTGPQGAFQTWQLSKREGHRRIFLPYVIIRDGENYFLHADQKIPITIEQAMHWFMNPDIFAMESLL